MGLILTLLALAAPAQAATDDDQVVQEAQRALRSKVVFVHPDTVAKVRLTADQQRKLRALVKELRVEVRIATLPAIGDPVEIVERVSRGTGVDGTYLVVTGRTLKATSNVLPPGQAARLSRRAFLDYSAEGVFEVLRQTVHAIGRAEARQDEGETLPEDEDEYGLPVGDIPDDRVYDPIGSPADDDFGEMPAWFGVFFVIAIGLALVRGISGGGWGSGSVNSRPRGFWSSGSGFGGSSGSSGGSSGSSGSSDSGGGGGGGGFDSGGGGGTF